jgi:hypothetical protein
MMNFISGIVIGIVIMWFIYVIPYLFFELLGRIIHD